MTRYARPLLALLFLALLATPWLMRHFGRRAVVAEATSDPRTRYGFRMTESSRTAGLNFVHAAPTLDAKLAHIMPQVASMGAAVSVVDVDADGHADLYVTDSQEGSRNRLYRNRGNGTFEEIAAALGIAALNEASTGVSMGSAWGDYDNDGFPDLLLHRWGRQELFHNDGGRAFTRVSEQAGLPTWANINTATWLDFDRDGRLDFFMGGYFAEDVNLWALSTTKIMPQSFEYATNGGRKYLYRNLGGGGSRRSVPRAGSPRRAGPLLWWPPTCAAPAIRICSSPTTMVCRSSSSTKAVGSERSGARPASATRPRAA